MKSTVSSKCNMFRMQKRNCFFKLGYTAKKKNRFAKILHFSRNFISICFAKISCKNSELKKKMLNFYENSLIQTKYRFNPYGFRKNILAKKCEISQKSLRNANENFRIFHETFPSLQTLLQIQEYRKSLLNINISAKVPGSVPGIETKMKLSLKKKFYHEKKTNFV